ncbi:hypothetical protein BDV12DRAFT_168190 [Aspergillus spectabilis]
MSLKRKASFPSISSPQSAQAIFDRPFVDDSPKHLHCRTRKRVRNNRPNDQTVYDTTLRWLFTAQQRVQPMPSTPADQDEDMEPEGPTAVDHRQQSLLRFFRPIQPSRQPCPSTPVGQFPGEPSRCGNETLQGHDVGSVSPAATSDSGTMSPAAQLVDRDMDMDMDLGSGESDQNPRQWTGSLGWM